MTRQILTTPRLVLEELSLADAPFTLELVNDADYVRYIGDKKIRTLEDAAAYLEKGPIASYTTNGFGLWKVVQREAPDIAIGMCGLIRRDTLPYIDIGYAFLPQYRGKGFVTEAALACKEYCANLGEQVLCAIVDPVNISSVNVLLRLGMVLDKSIRMPGADSDVNLYSVKLEKV